MSAKIVRLDLLSAEALMSEWFYLQGLGKSAKMAGLWSWRAQVERYCGCFSGERAGWALLLLDWHVIQNTLAGEAKYSALDDWRARAWAARAEAAI